MSTSVASSTCGRKVKVREALIADESASDDLTPPILDKRQSLQYNKDHLETKRQIESLRKQFGAEWLQNQGGEMVKSVVGFESKSQTEVTKQFIDTLLASDMTSSQMSLKDFEENALCSTPLCGTSSMEEMPTLVAPHGDSKTTIYESADNSASATTFYQSALDTTVVLDSSGNNSDPEDDEVIYTVINEGTSQEVFLVVTDRHIRERDTLTGKTLTKWSIKTLESCERLRADTITLHFDMFKRDKKRRDYQIDRSECQKLEQVLRNILSSRPLSEMNQKLYRCAVCIAQFSRERRADNREATCPECKSSYVIEVTETPKKYSPDLKLDTQQVLATGKKTFYGATNLFFLFLNFTRASTNLFVLNIYSPLLFCSRA